MTGATESRGNILFRNTLYTASASVLWQILALVTLPILINSVGIEEFGIFALAAASFGYFGILSMPARQAMVKFTAQNEGDELELNRVFNSALVLNIGAGLLMGLILGVLAIYADVIFDISQEKVVQMKTLFAMYAVATIFIQPLSIYTSMLRGMQKAGIIATYDSVAAMMRVAVIALIYFMDGTILWYAINEICIELFRGIFLRSVVRKQYPYVHIDMKVIDKGLFRKILGYGGWTVLYVLSLLIVTQGSKIIIGAVLAVSAVTYFHIAGMLFNLINTVSDFIRSAVLPSGARAMAAGDHAFVDKLIYSGGKVSLCMLLPVAIMMAVFSGLIIRIWMGEEFVDSTVLLSQIMIASWLFILPTFNLVHIYWGQKDISTLSLLSIVLSVIFIPLSIVLMGSYGIDGVGIATFLFYAVQLPFQFRTITSKIDIDIKRYILNVCFPIYAVSILYGYLVYEFVISKLEVTGLLLLVLYFGIAVITGILINILLTSRDEGLMIMGKFQQLIVKT